MSSSAFLLKSATAIINCKRPTKKHPAKQSIPLPCSLPAFIKIYTFSSVSAHIPTFKVIIHGKYLHLCPSSRIQVQIVLGKVHTGPLRLKERIDTLDALTLACFIKTLSWNEEPRFETQGWEATYWTRHLSNWKSSQRPVLGVHRDSLLITLAQTAHVSCRWPGYQNCRGWELKQHTDPTKTTVLGFRGIYFPILRGKNTKTRDQPVSCPLFLSFQCKWIVETLFWVLKDIAGSCSAPTKAKYSIPLVNLRRCNTNINIQLSIEQHKYSI